MIIDIFCHVFPNKYKDIIYRHLPPSVVKQNRNLQGNELSPALWDMDTRIRVLEEFDEYVQVLSINMPSPDIIPNPQHAAEAARVVNDEMAEIVVKHPDRFVAGVASLAMTNVDASLTEIDRAIKTLGLKGIRVDTNVRGKPLDSAEFMPIYEKMASYDLPIWLHPVRDDFIPDYTTEKKSKYGICTLFGWPYETAAAMTRLVCSGVMAKYPNLKIITHHLGGLVPFFSDRIVHMWDFAEERRLEESKFIQTLEKRPVEYFRMFYGDTVVGGGPHSLMCGYQFFGADHLLFGTDMPFGLEHGRGRILQGLRNMEQLDIPLADKRKMYGNNAKKLLRLTKDCDRRP
jgi:aminocarboxymuconate-semialdehyde decarboxylase